VAETAPVQIALTDKGPSRHSLYRLRLPVRLIETVAAWTRLPVGLIETVTVWTHLPGSLVETVPSGKSLPVGLIETVTVWTHLPGSLVETVPSGKSLPVRKTRAGNLLDEVARHPATELQRRGRVFAAPRGARTQLGLSPHR